MICATLLSIPCSHATTVARSAPGGKCVQGKVILPAALARRSLHILNSGCGPKFYKGNRGGPSRSCAPGANQYYSSCSNKQAPYLWGRTLKEFFDQAEKMMEGSESFGEREREFTLPFPIDTQQDSSSYTILADLPGLTKNDIKMRVNANKRTVDITAERKRPSTNEEESAAARRRFRRSERVFGKLARQLELPEDADMKGISARCENGVLRVVVPRVAKEEPDVQDIPIA